MALFPAARGVTQSSNDIIFPACVSPDPQWHSAHRNARQFVHRINTIELAHTTGQMAIRRFNDRVIVISHLAESVAAPIEPITHLAQPFQPSEAVIIIEVNRPAPVSARRDVIQPTGRLESKRARHA